MKSEGEPTFFYSPDQWTKWLTEHGKSESELWVGLYKKDSKKKGISYEESVEVALCFGWIDGLTKRVDEDSYRVRFTPRKPRSNWSASNIARVERLMKEGKMTPAGLAHVEAAKSDGRWTV